MDHVYVNFTSSLVPRILHHKISDHFPIYLHISLSNQEKTRQTVRFRSFTEVNKQMFTRALSNVTWEEILTHDDVNVNFNLFFNTFSTIYDQHFPCKTKQISSKRINNPWISTGILNSMKTKNKMYK